MLLTLLSIIQAIALENLWQQTVGRQDLAEMSWFAALGWLQASATFLSIVLVWLAYVALAMRFRWTPALSDTALPLIVGIAQFALIELTTVERLGHWCFAFAVLAVVGIGIDYRFMRRARRDPRNKEFFDTVQPASLRDFAPQIAYVAIAVAAGCGILMTTSTNWIGWSMVVFVNIAIMHNIWLQIHYWDRSMR